MFELAKIKYSNITSIDGVILFVSFITMVYTLFVYCKAYESVKEKLCSK